jgi:hypothetical protein
MVVYEPSAGTEPPGGLAAWAIALTVAACVLGVGVIAAVIFWLRKKKGVRNSKP